VLTRRIWLLPVAVCMAFIGLTFAPVEAKAQALPVYTEGVRAPKTHGIFTYYLKPGNMLDGKIVAAKFGGSKREPVLRKDGVFVMVLAKRRLHTIHITLINSDGDSYGEWVKFKKVYRGGR
jgi:hypothetical protein